ncbi:hypothetical protein EB169_08210 [archaeon]|nr:hypothetical protein [archaeon]
MSNQLEALKNKIKEILSELKEEEEDLKKEVTTTGDVAGYDTPRAFSKDGKHTSDYVKRMASLTGYTSLEIEKFLEWYGRIKKENAMKGENFWKRTNHHIYRIRERLSNISKNVTYLKK